MRTRFLRYKRVFSVFTAVVSVALLFPFVPANAATTASFVENQGQVRDDAVKFYLRGSGYGFYFAEDGVSMDLWRYKKEEKGGKADSMVRRTSLRDAVPPKQEGVVIKSTFVGAQTPTIIGEKEKIGKVSYFVGKQEDWKTKIPSYGEVLYKDLYPNIDLRYMATEKGMKYQFEVHPGGDPKAIRVALSGQDKLSIDSDGNLVMHTKLGEFKDAAPVTFQNIDGKQIPVSSEFAVKDLSDYGFKLASYDPSHTLIIDPGLVYSTMLDSDAHGNRFEHIVDSQGAVYYIGTDRIDGTLFDFVAKLSPDGTSVEQKTYFEATLTALRQGPSGNIVVTGYVNDAEALLFPAPLETYSGGKDAVVLRLLPDLTLINAIFFGGSGSDDGDDVALDSNGYIYIGGATNSTDLSQNTSNPGYDTTCGTDGTCNYDPVEGFTYGDGFVAKFSPDLSSLIYSTYLGGSGGDNIYGLAVDSDDRPFVVGSAGGSDFPVLTDPPGTNPPVFNHVLNGNCSSAGGSDDFATKLSPSGNSLVYSTFLKCITRSWDFFGDSSGNAYITGVTYTSEFPTTPGSIDPNYSGGEEILAIKIGAEGNLIYSTFVGGDTSEDFFDHGHGITADDEGNAYVTGVVSSPGFETTEQAYDRSNNAGDDMYLAKISPDGSTLKYGTFFGGFESYEEAMSLALGPDGAVYLYGFTRSDDFPVDTMLATNFFSDVIVKIDNPDTQGWVARHSGPGEDFSIDVLTDTQGNSIVVGDSYNGLDYDIAIIKYDSNGNIFCQGTSGETGSEEGARAAVIDSLGNTTITGWWSDGSNIDFVTVQFNSSCQRQWVDRFDGGINDEAGGIAVDSSGNLYVTGHSYNGQNFDYLTLKYSQDGRVKWRNPPRFDRGGDDKARFIAVDPSDEIIVSGFSESADQDFVTVKYDSKGDLLWEAETNVGTNENPAGLAVDGSGNIYMTGRSFTGLSTDYITAKYDSQGGTAWERSYDNLGSDFPMDLAVDNAGSVYVTGGSYNGRDSDFATVKYDSLGTEVWVNRYDNFTMDSSGQPFVMEDTGREIFVDSSGNIIVSGGSFGRGYGPGWIAQDNFDMATIMYSPDGKKMWLARYDNKHDDFPSGVAQDNLGNIIVAGRSSNGTDDDFVTIKYTPAPVPSTPPPPPGGELGVTVSDIRVGVAGRKGAFTETSTFAQGDTVTFRTTVVDENGLPVVCDSAQINITGPESPVVSNGPCDANGVVDIGWKTSAPKKSNPGTTPGAYSAMGSDVSAAGFVFDGASPTVNFDVTP
ncbi:MAG TPA: SBBP repeat-containing protein [Nitrospiria bacterium]